MYTFEVIFINDGGERVTRTVDARRVFETYSSRQLRDRALASCTGRLARAVGLPEMVYRH